MSRLHATLVASYAEHYARSNASVDPAKFPVYEHRAMELRYGDLIRDLPKNSKVLDLGCGTGITLSWLAKHPHIVPVGVDGSAEQARLARQFLPGIAISHDDGLAYLKNHPDTYMGIFCTDVLEHVPTDDLLLEWMESAYAALKPGGFFYCRMPNGANLTASYARYRDMTHMRCFTTTSMLQLLEAGRFTNCRVMPQVSGRFAGRIRCAVEAAVHRAVFRLCGHNDERIFTKNVCAVGYKPQS